MPEYFKSVTGEPKPGKAQFIEPVMKKMSRTPFMEGQVRRYMERENSVVPGYKMVVTDKETLNQKAFY